MSRVFKRPMFRRGGNVGSGIMTGIVDRSMHKENPFVTGNQGMLNEDYFPKIETSMNLPDTSGNIDMTLPSLGENLDYTSSKYDGPKVDIGTPTSVEDYISQIKAGAGEYGGMDPLTSYLLTAGPQIAKATSFGDAISKLEKPNAALIAQQGKKAAYDRDLRLAATKMGIADKNKFEDRRFELAKDASTKDYQQFLTQDERKYLQEVEKDKRIYNMDIIKNTKEFELSMLKDNRAYEKLTEEDKREYNLKIDDRARSYQALDETSKKIYEEKLIKEERAFELQKIIRNEEFVKERYKKEQEDKDLFGNNDFMDRYDSKTLSTNRATFENDNIEQKLRQLFPVDQIANPPLVDGGQKHGTIESIIKNKKANTIGNVYYDVTDGTIKQITKKDGVWGHKVIDINNYKPEEVTDDGVVLTEYQKKIIDGVNKSMKEKEEAKKKKYYEDQSKLEPGNIESP